MNDHGVGKVIVELFVFLSSASWDFYFLKFLLLFHNYGIDINLIYLYLFFFFLLSYFTFRAFLLPNFFPEIFSASINKTLQRKIELLIFYWVFLKLSFLGLSESIQNYVFLTLTKLCYKGIVLTHLFYILLTIAPVSYLLLFPNQWLNWIFCLL